MTFEFIRIMNSELHETQELIAVVTAIIIKTKSKTRLWNPKKL